MPRKQLLTPPPLSRAGRAARRSAKSGTPPQATHSKTWSAPPYAANSNPRTAAARFLRAAVTHHSEEGTKGAHHADYDFSSANDRRFQRQQFRLRYRHAHVFGKLSDRRRHARLHASR